MVRVRVRVRGRVRVECTFKRRVRVEIFKDETDLIFMQISTQNDEIEVTFMHITIPCLHIDHSFLLGLGLVVGLGLIVYP
jgi:hypothetical protein